MARAGASGGAGDVPARPPGEAGTTRGAAPGPPRRAAAWPPGPAGIFLSLVFVLLAFRAATQSLAHDEALTYRIYLAGPLSNIFEFYDANHHFLATILMRISTAVLGNSEFAVRLPSVASAALYCWVVYRLTLLLFDGRLLALWGVAVLATNPLLLDFLVAARGYGPAVALYFCSIWLLLRYSTGERRRALLYKAAAALSCSVMANMTMVFPAFVLAATFLAAMPPPEPAEPPSRRKRQAGRPPSRLAGMAHFAGPILACALLYWVAAPVSKARTRMFQQPASSLADSVHSLVRASHTHNKGLGGLNSDSPVRGAWLRAARLVLYPSALLLALAGAVHLKRRTPAALLLRWAAAAIAGSLVLYLVMHRLTRWPYPADRTGVYLLALFALVLVSLPAALRDEPAPWRLAGRFCVGFGVLLAGSHLLQLNWTHFYVWPYDADNRSIIARLESLRRPDAGTVNVGISWQLEPSFNYYRHSRRLDWLPPFNRSGPRGDHDYYVVTWNDRPLLRERNLEILYEGPNSGTVLARPRQQLHP